ncbi:MAG TPA: TetR/AcrR family transcriptional regulator [Lacipirellulaceae bacterium]
MRITAEVKKLTRQRILDSALTLFRTRGYETTTTRDIADAAEIATGTLFNYFATKEAIVACLADQALGKARAAFARQETSGELAEQLFAYVAAELRPLKPLRKFIMPLLETSLSPLAAPPRCDSTDSLRADHLATVAQLARKHGLAELSPVALQVYWSLYIGVLAFWATDRSPKQEDTLALLDQSLSMFARWLQGEPDETPK